MEKVPYIDLFSSAQKWRTNHFEKASNQNNVNTFPNFYNIKEPSFKAANQRAYSVNTKNQQRPFTTNYYDQAIKICTNNKILQGIVSPTYNQLKKFDFIKTNHCSCNYQNNFHKHQPFVPTKQPQAALNTKNQSNQMKLNLNIKLIQEQRQKSQAYSTTKYMDNASDLISKEGTDRFSKSSRSKGNNYLSPRDCLKQTAQFNSKESINNDFRLTKTNSKKIVSFKQISNTVINSQILDPQRVSPPNLRSPSKNLNSASSTHLNTIRLNNLVTNMESDLNKRIKQLSVNEKQQSNKQWMLQELQQIKEQNILLNKQFVMKLDHIIANHDQKQMSMLQMSKSTGSLRRKKLFVTQAQL